MCLYIIIVEAELFLSFMVTVKMNNNVNLCYLGKLFRFANFISVLNICDLISKLVSIISDKNSDKSAEN